MKTHTGGCHCGKVRYEVTTDPAKPIASNLLGLWLTFVEPDQFKLLSAESELTEYRFDKHVIHHVFCRTCGVESFAHGTGSDKQEMYAINVRCLDGVDISTLNPKPFDGRSL